MTREEAKKILEEGLWGVGVDYHRYLTKSHSEAVDMAIEALKEPGWKKGKWIIEEMNTYELSYGTTAYEPVYRCSVCERLTESYLRLDEPIMPEDADFPRFCPWCGAEMEGENDGKDNS